MRRFERMGRSRGAACSAAHLALWALLAIAVVPLQAHQNPEAPQLPPGIRIEMKAQPLNATVGDRIQIDYDLTFPAGYQFQFPALPEQLGEFTVLETSPGPIVPGREAEGSRGTQSPGEQHHHARLVVAVYRTGEFEFPALPFGFRDAAGKQIEAPGPPAKIRIESVLTGESPELKDLKKQAEIGAAVNWLLWLTVFCAAALLALLAWWWLRRNRKPILQPLAQIDIDSLDQAEAELRNLIGLGLPDKGMVKQFYIALSEIVKKALEAACGIQTVEKTTSEIVAALAVESEGGGPAFETGDQELVETLLLSCDMVKFARYLPARPESDEAAGNAARILAACRAARQAPSPAPASVAGVS